jgi:hypothetical protein
VRYALGEPLHPLVVTNIYNDPVYYNHLLFNLKTTLGFVIFIKIKVNRGLKN